MDWKGLEIRLQDVWADKICQPEHPEARRDYSLIYIDRLEVVLLRTVPAQQASLPSQLLFA